MTKSKMNLIMYKASCEAISSDGGLADGLRFLTNTEHRRSIIAVAERWVEEAIAAVKSAPDNPYGDDDEAICEAILNQTQGRKRVR